MTSTVHIHHTRVSAPLQYESVRIGRNRSPLKTDRKSRTRKFGGNTLSVYICRTCGAAGTSRRTQTCSKTTSVQDNLKWIPLPRHAVPIPLAEPSLPMDSLASQTDPPLVHHAHHTPGKNLPGEVFLMNLYPPSDGKRDCISKRVLRSHLLSYCSQWESQHRRHPLHLRPYHYEIVFSTCLYPDGVFVAVGAVLIAADTCYCRFGHAHGREPPAFHLHVHIPSPRLSLEDCLWTGVHRVLPVPDHNSGHGSPNASAPLRRWRYCRFPKQKLTRVYRPATSGRTYPVQLVRVTRRSTALRANVYTTRTVVGPAVSIASVTAEAATRACFRIPVLPSHDHSRVRADATMDGHAHGPIGARSHIQYD